MYWAATGRGTVLSNVRVQNSSSAIRNRSDRAPPIPSLQGTTGSPKTNLPPPPHLGKTDDEIPSCERVKKKKSSKFAGDIVSTTARVDKEITGAWFRGIISHLQVSMD